MQDYRYNPSSGGHAPGHVRDYFAELIERQGEAPDTDYYPADMAPGRVVGLLWNCTDVMPSKLCSLLDLQPGSTYASGARRWRTMPAAAV